MTGAAVERRDSLRRAELAPIPRAASAASEVEDRLVAAIASGNPAPGARIVEAEMAAALGVSRVPVREALLRLHLRGILVPNGMRGLRVADFDDARITQAFELRHAIERIVLHDVMRDRRNRESVFDALDGVLGDMRALSGSGDPLALSRVDLEFHRTIARHSGNPLAASIWEGLSQHMLIVFCRDWSDAADRTGEVRLHEDMAGFIREGAPRDIDAVLGRHFSSPAGGSRGRPSEDGGAR